MNTTSRTYSPLATVLGVVVVAAVIFVAWRFHQKTQSRADALATEAARLYHAGQFDEAIAKADAAIELNGSMGEAYFVRATARWEDLTARRLTDGSLYDQVELDFERARDLLGEPKYVDLCKRSLLAIKQYRLERRIP
jgi:tetratricopeptide (TPR) repeat protein